MRRLVIILGGLFAGVLVTLATLPWWLGPVLHAVGHRYHAEFSTYERIGYARFALHDVVVSPGRVAVRADRAETETPLVWLYHRLAGRPAAISVAHWTVVVAPSPSEAAAPATDGSGALRTRGILFKVADGLERWAPQTDIGAGSVQWPGGGLKLASAQWNQRTLSVRALNWLKQTTEIEATFAKSGELLFAARPTTAEPWQISLKSTGEEIAGSLSLFDQHATLAAHLPAQGWIPASADLQAEKWVVPASQLSLGDAYATIRGAARVTWREGRFEVSADAAGEPSPGKKAPPLAARVHGSGDRMMFTIDSLAVDVPGMTATLSAPVVMDYQGRAEGGASHFSLAVDLEKQPWLAGAKGRLVGGIDVRPTGKQWPGIAGSIEARDLKWGDGAIARLTAAFSLDWPRFELKPAVVEFAEGGKLVVRGGLDLEAKTVVEAAAEGTIRPAMVAHWLPSKVAFESATVTAKAHGPWAALQHEGQGQVSALRLGRMKSLAVEAAWKGTGFTVDIPEARITAGESRITLAAAVGQTGATVTALHFFEGGAERLALTVPASVHWSPQVEVSSFQLAGANASLGLSAAMGEAGWVAAQARNFPSSWLKDFVPTNLPEWRLAALDARGEWARGPLKGTVHGDLMINLAPGQSAAMNVAAKIGADGIEIEDLRVTDGDAAIVTATGRVPLTLHPRRATMVEFQPDAPLTLQATSTPNRAFWKTFAQATGLEFEDPEVKVALSGTWANPRGEARARAARMAADARRVSFPFPTVEALDFQATADSRAVTLDRFSARVEGQVVRLSGHFPVDRGQWPELRRAPVSYLRRNGQWRLEVPDADLAALAKFFPRYLAPMGRLQLDASVKDGGEMSGSLRLRDAATRPFGPLGVLQSLQAEVELSGRTVRVVNLAAQSGGQPVTVTGQIELRTGGEARYDLALKGKNLPLVRQTGVLLRADLDLKLVTPPGEPTAVTGAVMLRDSMFLSDVRAFIPKGGTSDPLLRPPFFSVDLPPFNAWRLAVDVRGEKFLRLRSPVFTGVASARFRLGGTLGEPRATGEAVIDSGQVLLPFANFRVEQGTVRLTESDPYSLRLYVTGTSRRYGYDLRMEMTGTAADPIVAFSSSPPLETSQVLLMVTAGELPQNEISYGTNQRVARLGTYLGQTLINDFGSDATEADRLSISTGERVSRQGRETYDVEYRVNERLTLVGEYDEFDDYNAGIKWRLFAPKPAPAPPPAAAKPPQPQEANDAPPR